MTHDPQAGDQSRSGRADDRIESLYPGKYGYALVERQGQLVLMDAMEAAEWQAEHSRSRPSTAAGYQSSTPEACDRM